MLCPVCNKECKENAVFCAECGTPFTIRQQAFNTYKPGKIVKPLSTGSFFWLIILTLVPFVNFLVFFILSFKKNININLRNYSRSVLLFMIILTLIEVTILSTLFYFGYLMI